VRTVRTRLKPLNLQENPAKIHLPLTGLGLA
jgi:hypothetical protein